MATTELSQGTILKTVQDDFLLTWAEAFLTARKAENKTAGTLAFYRKKFKLLEQFCEGRAITRISQLSADEIRRFLLWLAESGHNPGGVHACYRTVKTFLRWYELEAEPADWRNPITRVKPPTVDVPPLEPVGLPDIKKLLAACQGDGLNALRDKAVILALLDTGCRAGELLSFDLADLDLHTGALTVRKSKSRRSRSVFLGKSARKAARRYLTARKDDCAALWVTDEGERMKYAGLRSMLTRRSKAAGIEPPDLHSFRRAFALNSLRAGMDIFSLQKLMGHSSLQVMRRYLDQDDTDTATAHAQYAPGDRL